MSSFQRSYLFVILLELRERKSPHLSRGVSKHFTLREQGADISRPYLLSYKRLILGLTRMFRMRRHTWMALLALASRDEGNTSCTCGLRCILHHRRCQYMDIMISTRGSCHWNTVRETTSANAINQDKPSYPYSAGSAAALQRRGDAM